MSTEIKVPQLPESVSDATLVAWHKKAGDRVSRDENLADLETDKVVLEVPAPADGTLAELRVEEGTTVNEGDVLAVLEKGEAGDDAGDEDGAERRDADESSEAARDSEKDDREKVAKDEDRDDESEGGKRDDQAEGNGKHKGAGEEEESSTDESGRAAKTSPAVRRLLDEHDLDATMVSGSGKDGRITKSDVMKFLKSEESGEDETPAEGGTPAAGERERTEQRVPMSRLRARIAERLVEAQQSAAMLTTFNEVDLTEVIALRKRYRDKFEKEYGVRLGFMSFFAKAAVEALKKFPVVNASVEDQEILYHNYYDIGIAVSTERGLLVPVLRDVDRMGFAEFESKLADLAARAQDGKISMDELTGGTFSITNGGIFGSMMSTPILNQPQSAILGMHAIQERPMVVDGEIAIRPMMYLALTYDHRIIDGKDSVQFLVTIKEQLEDPSRLLLRI
jgi:2-oxoglutarate dehydrogenase E2 component (dihydrolipoamide succinyltransferase)